MKKPSKCYTCYGTCYCDCTQLCRVSLFNPKLLNLKGWWRQLTLISLLHLSSIWSYMFLQKLFETKRLKLLPNIKTKWISMLSFANQVLAKYKTLMLKMNDDLSIVVLISINIGYLYGIEVVMGLTCIMLKLEVIHALISLCKVAKLMYVFLWLLLRCVVLNYTKMNSYPKKILGGPFQGILRPLCIPVITC